MSSLAASTIAEAPARLASRPLAGASLASSSDGRWLAVALGERIWLEDRLAATQVALPHRPGHDLAITDERLWIARGGRVESIPLDTPDAPAAPFGVDAGSPLRLAATGRGIAITGARGTWLARDHASAPVSITTRDGLVRSIGDGRVLVTDDSSSLIVEVTDAGPRAVRHRATARILDASCILDRTTHVLLVARENCQELVVMRHAGIVLTRIRVANVVRIHGSARAYVVALATADGRVIVYDLRERQAISVDQPASSLCEVALAPDGRHLIGLARRDDGAELFERRLEPPRA